VLCGGIFPLLSGELNRFRVFDLGILRRILYFRVKNKPEIWKALRNEELPFAIYR
jgi:hypothetical protein